MQIITIASGKGGSCKTTTALSVAAFLSKKRKTKVLVIDTDPQGSLSWISDRASPGFDVAHETDHNVISKLRKIGGYDYILCDTPPGLDNETLTITLKLSDFAILPSPPSPLDIRELTRTIGQVVVPSETAYRVLLSRVDSRRINEALDMQSQLMDEDIPVFNAVVRYLVAHERAILDGKLITEYKGSGGKEAANDYRKVVDELVRELKGQK
ncbi:ParA family protein [Acaryochloris marina]|uniref:Conserved CobQ/CobB/MinD/ParA domain n=1 Tax=Acaryochloris marina (strain MBIC 11017) TaxID=329726 RepID=A8ZQY4_ACAM1|nr:ParA family protein [Acaryochloris marina]ABW33420.1 Conserved CobQ/CobB/MinD/ParA domain [Acaryochloris marina MBIC11017]